MIEKLTIDYATLQLVITAVSTRSCSPQCKRPDAPGSGRLYIVENANAFDNLKEKK